MKNEDKEINILERELQETFSGLILFVLKKRGVFKTCFKVRLP